MGYIWKNSKVIFGGAIALVILTFAVQYGYQQLPVHALSSTATAIKTGKSATEYDLALDTLDNMGREYGITISTNPPSTSLPYATWSILGAEDRDNVIKMTRFLEIEWSKYPLDYVRSSKVKHLYFVKGLYVNGQYRAAMPDPSGENAVYYDISSKYLNSQNGSYMRNVIHHEFDHIVEYNVFGNYAWNDTAWKACNITGFSYGAGGAAAYSNTEFSSTKHVVTGFVTGYGTYGIEEDKAEVFAELMTNYDGFRSLSETDSNLSCKFNLYQKYIQTISPSMTPGYLDSRS